MTNRAWLLGCVAVVLGILFPGLLRAQDASLQNPSGASTDERVAQLEKEVADLKAGQASTGGNMFDWKWDNGLVGQTPGGDVKFKLGGRLQYDFGFINQSGKNKDAFGDIEDASKVRRLRLCVSGDISDAFYKIEVDFAGGDAKLKDAFIGYTNIPLIGNIRVGHQKEPMGLDELASDNIIKFPELALPEAAFTPDRNLGIMAYNTALDKRMTWALGVFRDTDDEGTSVSDDGGSVTGRLTCLPYISEEKDKLLHLGISGSYRKPPDSAYSIGARPEWFECPKFADTGSFATDDVELYGLEAAWVCGSFDLQAELLGACTDAGNVSGWYVQGGYWLTGEHNNYDQNTATFTRVCPKNDFSPSKGAWGAWQLNARYSTIDLNDDTLAGGKVNNVSAGLNWQLNPNMRVMMDDIYSMPKDKGAANIVLVRMQVDF